MIVNTKTLKSSGMGLAVLAVLALPVAASAASDTANTVINATVESTISVSSFSPVEISLTPSGSEVVSSASDTVTVSTNNSGGYTLTLVNADGDTDLVSGTDTISAHAGTPAVPTALVINTWGYAVAGGNF